MERAALERLGIRPEKSIPIIVQDPGIIVATDTGELEVPSMLDYLKGNE